MNNNKNRIDRLVKLALLAAISLVLVFFAKFPIFPAAAFLEYDFADVPILIGTFMFGPVAGLALTAVVSVLQWLFASPASGWVGALMHVLATGSFVVIAGTIYSKMHTLKGAVISLICGLITMIAVTIPLNILISPVYFIMYAGMTYSAGQSTVISMLGVFIAFNAIKAAGNALLTFLLYKSVSKVLKIELVRK